MNLSGEIVKTFILSILSKADFLNGVMYMQHVGHV